MKTESLSSGEIAKCRDEIFKRIRASTLVRLLQEREVNESVYAMGDGDDGNDSKTVSSVIASKAGPGPSVKSKAATSIASLSSVAGSVVSVVDTDTTIDESRDLVLLDLREDAEYDRCHLPLAMSYPAHKINRDQFTPELHRCKRDASKLLVVYHTDDQATAGVSTLLVQKGWENVHCLSGGFEELVASYPEVLEGEIPERPDTGGTARSRQTKPR